MVWAPSGHHFFELIFLKRLLFAPTLVPNLISKQNFNVKKRAVGKSATFKMADAQGEVASTADDTADTPDPDSQAKQADQSVKIVVPVTCAIYHNGKEKLSERWCFELGISIAADANMSKVLKRLHLGFGIKEKSEFLNIAKFKVKLLSKDFKPRLPEWPKGRIFSIDSQEQWETVLPKILSHERELIGKAFIHIAFI